LTHIPDEFQVAGARLFQLCRRCSFNALAIAAAETKVRRSRRSITPQVLSAAVRRTSERLTEEIQKLVEKHGSIVASTSHMDIWSAAGVRIEMHEMEILFGDGKYLSFLAAATPIEQLSADGRILTEIYKSVAAKYATHVAGDSRVRRAPTTATVVDGDATAQNSAKRIQKFWRKLRALSDRNEDDATPVRAGAGPECNTATPRGDPKARADRIATQRTQICSGPNLVTGVYCICHAAALAAKKAMDEVDFVTHMDPGTVADVLADLERGWLPIAIEDDSGSSDDDDSEVGRRTGQVLDAEADPGAKGPMEAAGPALAEADDGDGYEVEEPLDGTEQPGKFFPAVSKALQVLFRGDAARVSAALRQLGLVPPNGRTTVSLGADSRDGWTF
jgi:hypothetical protein